MLKLFINPQFLNQISKPSGLLAEVTDDYFGDVRIFQYFFLDFLVLLFPARTSAVSEPRRATMTKCPRPIWTLRLPYICKKKKKYRITRQSDDKTVIFEPNWHETAKWTKMRIFPKFLTSCMPTRSAHNQFEDTTDITRTSANSELCNPACGLPTGENFRGAISAHNDVS